MIGLKLSIIAFVVSIIFLVVFIFCACIVSAREDIEMKKMMKKMKEERKQEEDESKK